MASNAIRNLFFEDKRSMALIAFHSAHVSDSVSKTQEKILFILSRWDSVSQIPMQKCCSEEELVAYSEMNKNVKNVMLKSGVDKLIFQLVTHKEPRPYLIWRQMPLVRVAIDVLDAQPHFSHRTQIFKNVETPNPIFVVCIHHLNTIALRSAMLLLLPSFAVRYTSSLVYSHRASENALARGMHRNVIDETTPPQHVQAIYQTCTPTRQTCQAIQHCIAAAMTMPLTSRKVLWNILASKSLTFNMANQRQAVKLWLNIQADLSMPHTCITTYRLEISEIERYEERCKEKQCARVSFVHSGYENAGHYIYDLNHFRTILILFIFNGIWEHEDMSDVKVRPQIISKVWDNLIM